MVKYGKEYRKLQLDEWKKYYINYKTLKQKIKEMKQTLFNEIRDSRGLGAEFLSVPLIPDDSPNIEKTKENESLTSLYKEEKGKHLKEFIELLMQEFKRSYSFFIGIEKVLIKKMNTHLYTQTSYSTYSLSELKKEMKSISLTVYLAKCLNAFINDIMMAIKKILKKFDKNFSKLYGHITPHLILQLLSKKNSELEYMLQFKIIDEITTISQSNIKELKNYFDQNNENSKESEEYRTSFLEKYNETLQYIEDIDELTYFKTQYKEWIDYTSGRNTLRKGFKYFENDIFNPILSSSYYKDNLLDKFLSTKEAFNTAKKIQKSITSENRRNIILILVQAFFYNSLLTCVFPIMYYYEYIRSLGNDKLFNDLWFVNIFIFLVFAFSYLGQYLSIFFFYNYTSRKHFKSSYLISYFLIFVGSLLYIFSILSKQGHFKIRALILGFSRTLIGLGSNPMIGKKYITIYSPRYYLPLISKIYLIVEMLGFILGPAIEALLLYVDIGEIFCLFNCIGYYGAIGSFILFIVHYIFFVSPQSEFFFIIKNTGKGEDNKSTSQSTEPFVEDMEDSQDLEFYRMQKEKKEKKYDKNKLEVTKSDEINIEINDNESSKITNKTVNNTIDSNINDEKKEEDDTNYNKILEGADDILGQNEMAENHYKNVDLGRFSNLDITNEQRDTIKEIEAKLYEYQEKSNFTYINMMPRTLDDIILNEQKTFGYVNRNLLIMLVLLFINNLIKENLVIHSSYFMLFKVYKNGAIISGAEEIHNNTIINQNETDIINNKTNIDISYMIEVVNYISGETNTNQKENLNKQILQYSRDNMVDLQIICFLTSAEFVFQLVSIFFIMPFYKINIFFKKNLIIFMIASVVLMVPLSFGFINKNIYLYVPFITIEIFMHKVIEIICSCYLVYLIPPKWRYSHIRASSLPIYLMTLSKIIACLICLASFNRDKIAFNQHLLTTIAGVFYGLIGLFIYKSRNFRVNSLPRILRQREL